MGKLGEIKEGYKKAKNLADKLKKIGGNYIYNVKTRKSNDAKEYQALMKKSSFASFGKNLYVLTHPKEVKDFYRVATDWAKEHPVIKFLFVTVGLLLIANSSLINITGNVISESVNIGGSISGLIFIVLGIALFFTK